MNDLVPMAVKDLSQLIDKKYCSRIADLLNKHVTTYICNSLQEKVTKTEKYTGIDRYTRRF